MYRMALMYTDEKLVEECLKGKRHAYKLLYNRYAVKMLGVCMRYVKNQDEAEDILQEGFVKVFTKMETYKNTGPLEAWIRRIMVNTALLQIRNRIKPEIEREINHYYSITENIEDENESCWETITSEDLFKMIQSLPDGYRTVFSLYVVDEYSHKEIGALLGISESTSKSQLSRARILLKKMIVKNYKQENIKIIHG
jgi:RNA polymerase sigma factor (sigma-70 family)